MLWVVYLIGNLNYKKKNRLTECFGPFTLPEKDLKFRPIPYKPITALFVLYYGSSLNDRATKGLLN